MMFGSSLEYYAFRMMYWFVLFILAIFFVFIERFNFYREEEDNEYDKNEDVDETNDYELFVESIAG